MGPPAGSSKPGKHRDNEPLIARRTRSVIKRAVRHVVPAAADQRRVLLVFGCQRSGTTMLQQSIMNRSWRTVILEEHDRRLIRAGDPERLRWESLEHVGRRIAALPFELVVAKPLVESHRVEELLDACGRAKGIWMLRHYHAVARSNLNRFGSENGLRDLRILVADGRSDWRCANSEDVRDRVASLLASALSPLDAAALFWWARNRLYFDQGLSHDRRMRVMRYEAFIQNPHVHLEALSEFIGLPLPLRAMRHRIRPATTTSETLRPDIEALCAELQKLFSSVPQLVPGEPGGGSRFMRRVAGQTL